MLPSESIEAEVRRLMARHAAIVERGWSTRQERQVIQLRIDNTLDAWQAAKDREACQAWEPALSHLSQTDAHSAESTDVVAPSDDLPVDGDWRNW